MSGDCALDCSVFCAVGQDSVVPEEGVTDAEMLGVDEVVVEGVVELSGVFE